MTFEGVRGRLRGEPAPGLRLPWCLVSTTRYRCDGCGNLTRFDVTVTQTTKSFNHYTVGGELEIEEEQVLARSVDDVVCRWCGHGRSVVEIDAGAAQEQAGEQPAVT